MGTPQSLMMTVVPFCFVLRVYYILGPTLHPLSTVFYTVLYILIFSTIFGKIYLPIFQIKKQRSERMNTCSNDEDRMSCSWDQTKVSDYKSCRLSTTQPASPTTPIKPGNELCEDCTVRGNRDVSQQTSAWHDQSHNPKIQNICLSFLLSLFVLYVQRTEC